jgi:hypothetical protein
MSGFKLQGKYDILQFEVFISPINSIIGEVISFYNHDP